MKIKSLKSKLLLFAVLLVVQVSFSQLSKTHYIPPLTAADSGSSEPENQYFYISTPSTKDVSVTIHRVGQSSSKDKTYIVSKTAPQEVYIDNGYAQLFIPSYSTGQIITDRGFIIEATDLIYVSVRMEAGGAQAGALVSKGASALGTVFRVGSYTNENPKDNYLNFVSVMATEDGTKVTFDDLPTGLIVKNYTGSFPINTTLNEGESFIVATNSFDNTINRDGLIGTLVKSDKPIVVNCGSANGSFHNGNARDYGIDQIVGADKIGNEFIFVRGFGSDGWENILIVAHEDNTAIYINGNTTAETTINAGAYHLIEGDKYSANGNMYVETSKKVFAYQGVGGLGNNGAPNEANQGMFFVPPLSCETKGNVDNIAQIDKIGSEIYNGGVSIVTKVGANITINKNPITASPNTVTGKPDYVTYKVLGLSGDTSVESDDELYCAYFNYNGSATSGSFYSGFPTAPEINFDNNFTTLGNCIDNITLEAANMGNFDSIEWYYDDGSGNGFIPTGNTTKTFKPTFPADGPFSTGTYKLIGITCTGIKIESIEIPVSICPDDTDNDGIIDNIDIDNDNDGILNCTESYGNQTINLADPTSGNLPIGGYHFIGDVKTVEVSSNSITGDINGNFTSSVASKNNVIASGVKHLLTFNKKLNLEISNNSALTNQDEFIIQVTNDKTITLLDPDNQLLVDTNFDGVYEAGITQFSSFEIRFKLNSTSLAAGTSTFKFVTSMVDFFTYKHLNISETNNSTASFKITATCLPFDADLDGITNEFDYDSDNDGIPDRVEGTGTLLTLSGNDSNLDGLDDIFDANILPIDNDNDKVPDYLDLDSDNDGIYDLEESNSNLPDLNFDGIIDNVNTTIGLNGWDDNAETSPDSGEINFNIRNIDGDSNFDYIDNDSDGDTCFDVFEAGFTPSDTNQTIIKGTSINSTNGLIVGSDGYKTPNTNYSTPGIIEIIAQPTDLTSCELDTTILTIETNTIDSYQWQVSIDNGNLWTDIIDDLTYSNSKTNKLTILNTPLSFKNYKYRVVLNTNGNSCGLISNEIILTVNALPIINPTAELTQCDDASNDGISFFNLIEAAKLIMPTISTEIITFYTTLTGAETADPNFLISDSESIAFEAKDGTKVYAKVTTLAGCFNIAEVTLFVEPTQLSSSFKVDFSKCDDNRDGITTFDFSNVTNLIYTELNTDASRVSIKYYENESDALAEINAIDPANYTNTNYPILTPITSHQIYVRIDSNNKNACIGLGPHVNLFVEALPFANPVTIAQQCDDDADGKFPFDTSTIESTVIGTQSNVTVSYFDENNNPLPSPLPNPFLTASQTITIKVTNNTTNATNGPCFDQTTLIFTVNVAPVANPVVIAPECDDESNDGIYNFNTTNIQATILGNQTGMEVHYFDASGNELSSPLPNPFSTATQTITVKVVNPLNTTCIASTNIDFVVNPLPDFEVDTPQIICTSTPNAIVNLFVTQKNNNENLDYEWKDSNSTVISTDKTTNISTPGIYFVTLTKKDGTLCSRTKSIEIKPSEIAKITSEDIQVKDDSDYNTITINTLNLGNGDYEFALNKDYGYQDEAIFEGVEAGIHTVFIRDKNNCGIAKIEVSVIGFPKFFTPNNDGHNDTWNVLGVNSKLYKSAKVYIFDRFGKLLKTFDPTITNWDGLFNGEQLPPTDYWFSVELIDTKDISKVRKGHFSLISK
ncbi:gliding motility-associated C-terminal domain-containing protein [Lutibacter sp. HS1-25]|uniref:T9SS type B sorting domain-containing protein n=1 Tax=Lutibacter sp. HS1-25 TaxID=2485000 RepID=UPI0010105F6E|nr:T9SS type B sorting domain-containing protein [Lutibacter sp. HS1-25]RXP44802.1 gliding motility-associated C-terminal domain-containing protein [Lutibacter sp. HS1-25]